MTDVTPRNPDYHAACLALLARQPAMATLGVAVEHLVPGEATLGFAHALNLTQHNGFIHAGMLTAVLDNACGMAAYSLMAAGAGILSVEFKVSLLSPANAPRYRCRARVIKAGRTLTFCEAQAIGISDGRETLIATMSNTLMAMLPAG